MHKTKKWFRSGNRLTQSTEAIEEESDPSLTKEEEERDGDTEDSLSAIDEESTFSSSEEEEGGPAIPFHRAKVEEEDDLAHPTEEKATSADTTLPYTPSSPAKSSPE